jgi:hypothetical protein
MKMKEGKLIEIDAEGLLSLSIPSLRLITKNSEVIGARGQTLSALRKRWLLKELRSKGIDTVIDLRAGDHSDSFPLACAEAGLECFHFPVDRSRTPDAVISGKLPSFIEKINSGGFYISCALGLHRTDIALSLYYMFSPEATEPPVLYGHIRDGKLRYDDIFQRAGSIKHRLTQAERANLGWDETFEREFAIRKKSLLLYQEDYLNVI